MWRKKKEKGGKKEIKKGSKEAAWKIKLGFKKNSFWAEGGGAWQEEKGLMN